MRFQLLRPVNGWAGFLTELTIVVVGILIALAAQQAVDMWRWKNDVREFRAAVDNELGYNLAAYIGRRAQTACIDRRLDQLDRWHKELQAGGRLRLTSRIGRPTTTQLRISVWESRTPDVTAHLGLDNRLAYAAMYDLFVLYRRIGDFERDTWGELLDFEGADSLDRRDMLRLRGLIERGRLYSRLTEGNWRTLARRAKQQKIRPWSDGNLNPNETFCDPLTWTKV
ncbi:hypothetical protein [Sphingomonas mesophila]|uniref:hypothetical protein n=1 Tax=Sphingomonas mesophila TaxID=2303576 RepID=UPI000E58F46C|nr:hypothetical protein [Sphingomonas mesophila]